MRGCFGCDDALAPPPSFRDAPLGAGPESILTIVAMDSGLALRAPRNDEEGSLSRQKFNAVGLAAAPDHFAWLVFGAIGHQRQSELVPDVDRDVGHDPGTARRHVQHGAFVPGHALIDRHPGRMLVQLTPRLTYDLRPWCINDHLTIHPD